MTASEHKSLASIGFLTVVDVQEVGLLGGFLAVDPVGRPLEFHCTTPVNPTRAQEILYGKSLQPFLCGELIGQALLDKCKSKPTFVLTDQPSMLATREFTKVPLVCIRDPQDEATDDMSRRVSNEPFRLGDYSARHAKDYETDRAQIDSHWQSVDALDMTEPFDRIREAIQETQS